ncbi:MAG: TldD/PmbA family protein [Gemmatimonadales bacterium]
MIERVLDLARRRAAAADAYWRRGESTSITFEAGRLKAGAVAEAAGINLRVVKDGRVGGAGSTAVDPSAPDGVSEGLVARACASAELGEVVDLAFPGRSPSPAARPRVQTYFDRAANASLDELTTLGRRLVERLAREGCQVNVSVARDTVETRVANTAGADDLYRSTSVSVSADLTRIAGDDVLMIYDYHIAADLPAEATLDALAGSIEQRLTAALTIVESPEGALPVAFTPSGLAVVLLPLEQALSGKSVVQGVSPLAGRVGDQAFDPVFSLTDDPLAPGRPGSRPFDDEAVPSATAALVERGVVRRFVYDLETASRAGTQSTGHGHRGVFGKPRIGYTNLVLGDGERAKGQGGGEGGPASSPLGGGLLDRMGGGEGEGLLVDELIGVGQGNVIGGAFSHPVGLAYRVRRGEVVGRVKDAAIAGNAYELLKRIGGFGTDGRWLGSRWAPSVLLEGVGVARR